MLYLYLAIGGVAGTFARYGLGGWVAAGTGSGFPWATLLVNLLGSFLLGLAVRGAETWLMSPEVRLMITVGFCGAFTTFSTFSFETLALLQGGAWQRAIGYSLGSLALGLASVALGLWTAGALARVGG